MEFLIDDEQHPEGQKLTPGKTGMWLELVLCEVPDKVAVIWHIK